MARDPGSRWSPLAEDGHQGSYPKNKFIVHSTGDRGTAAAIYNYFNRANVVVESTFVIGRGPEDPTRQLLDSASLADANLGANKSGISVEVVGTADDPFTDWQISELIRLGRWAHGVHPVPLQVVPGPDAGGYGWHVMFGAPGPWTPVAKACPGRTRINQLQTIVFPAIFAGTTPTVEPLREDDEDMATLVEIQADAGGKGGGYWLRDGAGYDWISDINTVSEFLRAGAKVVKVTQSEHANWVRAQDARKAQSAVTVEGVFPTAEAIAKALWDAQSARMAS